MNKNRTMLWFAVCIGLIFGSAAFAADNNIYWSGAGITNGLWSDSANWSGAYVSGNTNYVYIDTAGSADPLVNSTVITPVYNYVRFGTTGTTLVGLTMTGGDVNLPRTSTASIDFGYAADSNAYCNLSGGTIHAYQMLMPGAGHCDVNMTGGTLDLGYRMRLGGVAGHGGGTFNMSGGLIHAPASTGIDYIGLSTAAGAPVTFNMIDGTVNLDAFSITYAGSSTFNMSGGVVNLSNRTRVGENAGTVQAIWNMSGGTYTSTAYIALGFVATTDSNVVSTMNMSGGNVYTNAFVIGRYGKAKLNLSGGTITVNYQNLPAEGLVFDQFSTGDGLLDITDTGRMVWAGGDYTANVQGFIDTGHITAYAGSGRVLNSYISSNTVIEADDTTARYPIPANNAANVDSTSTIVEWQNPFPGETVYCDVWFGTDETMYGATKIVDHQAVSSASVTLVASTDYYWRVDTHDPETDAEITGVVWKFSTSDDFQQIWTGQGANPLWSTSGNWLSGYNPAIPNNYAIINATTGYDPSINSTVNTDMYSGVYFGNNADSNLVGLTMTGGTLNLPQTGTGTPSIDFGYAAGSNTYCNLSGGTMYAYQMRIPNAGHCDFDMTGGTLDLGYRMRLGNTAGHGGGTFDMSGGLIQAPTSTGIDYIGISYAAGAPVTFNMTGGIINLDAFGITNAGSGTFNMGGGAVTISDRTRVGEDAGTVQAIWNMSNGTYTSTNYIALGYAATTDPNVVSTMNMSGGKVYTDSLVIGRRGKANLNLSGGTITVNYQKLPAEGLVFDQYGTGDGLLDITGTGRMIWAGGDYDSNVSDFVDVGKIVAYGGSGRIIHGFNSGDGNTVIEADDDTARYPIPANNAVDVSYELSTIQWQNPLPGQVVDVWFGTDETMDDAQEIVHNQAVSSASVTVTYSVDYYWRVDTHNPASTGVVWKFSTADPQCQKGTAQGDFNGDCHINFKDVAIMVGNWLDCGWSPPTLCN